MDHQDGFWVERARRGDWAAFGLLVEKHTPMLSRLVSTRIDSPDEAADLIQEIWLQAYLNLDHLRQPHAFASWLYSIGLNRTRMWLRRQSPQHTSWDALRDESYANCEPYSWQLRSSDDPIDNWATRDAVLHAMAQLSAVNRDVVRLFYLDDLSYEQIAARLDLSVKTIKSRLHKARQQLRPYLESLVELPTTPVYKAEEVMVEATVYEVYTLDVTDEHEAPPDFTQTVVVLKARGRERYLPIWIGPFEGASIARHLRTAQSQRPMTFDLMAQLVERLGGRIEAVQLSALRETTYYATLRIAADGKAEEIDCRPSDALALALRVNAPILIAPDVLEQAGVEQAMDAADAEAMLARVDPATTRRVKSIRPLELKP